MKNMKTNQILIISQKPYEQRLLSEHKTFTLFLKDYFPTLNAKQIKLLTFYIEVIRGQAILTSQNYPLESFVIKSSFRENPQQNSNLLVISKNKSIDIHEDQWALVLNYQKYLNCQLLGETSIEQEIAFLYGSEYLCSMPKKKHLELLRNCRVYHFLNSQSPYFEDQLVTQKESGSGVYLIRKGEFAYLKAIKNHQKQIEVFRFSQGHLFGTLQLMSNSQSNKRVFTSRCKSEMALVYHFSQAVFHQKIQHYCEHILLQKQRKLFKHLIHPNQINSQAHSSSLIKTVKSLSLNFKNNDELYSSQNLIKTRRSQMSIIDHAEKSNLTERHQFPMIVNSQRQLCNSKMSEIIEQEGLRKTSYFSLKHDGPLKNYPMTIQRSKFLGSQFKDIDKVLNIGDKPKSKLENDLLKRGSVMFSFFRQSFYNDLKKKQQFQPQQ